MRRGSRGIDPHRVVIGMRAVPADQTIEPARIDIERAMQTGARAAAGEESGQWRRSYMPTSRLSGFCGSIAKAA